MQDRQALSSRAMGLIRHPLGRRVLWVLFAVVFFRSGLAFTTWLLEPDVFAGGVEWLWAGAFPVLLPAFFVVNRHLGCASGACRQGRCEIPRGDSRTGSAGPMP